MEVIMGIDVSSTELETHVLINSEKGLSSRFENSKKGCKKLLKYAEKHEVNRIVMEATGGYEQKIARAGMAVHLPVKIVNPAQVRHFAKGFGITAKTDKIDAYVIALFDEKVNPPEIKLDPLIELCVRKGPRFFIGVILTLFHINFIRVFVAALS